MNAWGVTDKGVVRTQNQDSFYIDVLHQDGQTVGVVCDGMGGAKAGNVASEMAVESFVEDIRLVLKPMLSCGGAEDALRSAVKSANQKVYEKSRSDEEFSGMGTTLVGVVVTGHTASIVNVGDSRAYFLNRDGIRRVTRDHSLVEDMIARGELTAEQARSHPSRNLITRALGTEEEIKSDLYHVAFEPGDYLLLCSDGLSNMITDEEIEAHLRRGGQLTDICALMVQQANARGGSDNITIVLFQF